MGLSFVCYNGQLFCEDGSAPFEADQRQDVTVDPKKGVLVHV